MRRRTPCQPIFSAGPSRPRRPSPLAGIAILCLISSAVAVAGCADLLGYDNYQIGTTTTGGAGGGADRCQKEEDCEGSPDGPRCDPVIHVCRECVPAIAGQCGLGLYCAEDARCAIGCAQEADCEANGQGPLTCDQATHKCTGCGANAPCPPGAKCDLQSGVCVPGCDASSDCPTSDYACCNKQCKDLQTDVMSCGACEDACVPNASTVWACVDGGCVFQSCKSGWADCDLDMSKGNGCETYLEADPSHCGDCGEVCGLSHATPGCSSGTCVIAACDVGFADCDKEAPNGCEANLASSLSDCGACGSACAPNNAMGACQSGVCMIVQCAAGFTNCNGVFADGCECGSGCVNGVCQ